MQSYCVLMLSHCEKAFFADEAIFAHHLDCFADRFAEFILSGANVLTAWFTLSQANVLAMTQSGLSLPEL